MDYVPLKGTDIKVSKLSLGTWSFSGSKNWGPNDEQESIDTIKPAIDSGINLLDTAAQYNSGVAETILGKAVKGRRDKVVLATKVFANNLRYDDVIAECEKSLKNMDTDYVDLYQIHWPNRDIPLEDTLRAFDKLKADGKIRAMGVCNFGPQCLAGVEGKGVVTNQLPYSLIWRQVEDVIVPASEKQGIWIWPYSPFGQGLLTGKFHSVDDVPMPRRETRFYSSKWKVGRHTDTGYEAEIFGFLGKLQAVADKNGLEMGAIALAFLKTRPGVGSVLIGARNPGQLSDNVRMFETKVSDAVMKEVVALADEIKPKMGTNPDLWDNKDGGRFF